MEKVKGLGNDLGPGCHFNYGQEYMTRIGKSSAKKLAKNGLPAMGYSVYIHTFRDDWGFLVALELQNLSGDFYLSSSSVPISDWPTLFGVEII